MQKRETTIDISPSLRAMAGRKGRCHRLDFPVETTCFGCGDIFLRGRNIVSRGRVTGVRKGDYCSSKCYKQAVAEWCEPSKSTSKNVSKKKAYKTIKETAEALLMQVSYVDVYGRKVGLTYRAILKKLHEGFPNGSPNWPAYRTSLRSLQMVAYALNGSQCQMPVRRRSSKVLARDYARALLLIADEVGLGYSFKQIARMVKRKFPEYSMLSAEQLTGLSLYLSRQKFNLPPRPED